MLFRMRGKRGRSLFLLPAQNQKQGRGGGEGGEGPFPISAHMGVVGWGDCERGKSRPGGKCLSIATSCQKGEGDQKKELKSENERVGKLPPR